MFQSTPWWVVRSGPVRGRRVRGDRLVVGRLAQRSVAVRATPSLRGGGFALASGPPPARLRPNLRSTGGSALRCSPADAGLNHLFRFLRSILELSGVDLARVLGTSPVSVSRWENGRAPMGVQADKLLRMLVAALPGQNAYSIEELQSAASSKEQAPLRVQLRLKGNAWSAMAA